MAKCNGKSDCNNDEEPDYNDEEPDCNNDEELDCNKEETDYNDERN